MPKTLEEMLIENEEAINDKYDALEKVANANAYYSAYRSNRKV